MTLNELKELAGFLHGKFESEDAAKVLVAIISQESFAGPATEKVFGKGKEQAQKPLPAGICVHMVPEDKPVWVLVKWSAHHKDCVLLENPGFFRSESDAKRYSEHFKLHGAPLEIPFCSS